MQIDFNIENQRLNKLNESFIVENSQNYLECSFIFSDDWQSFKKLAYFQSTLDSVPKIIEIVDDKCIVPHESIKAPFLKVWVIGYKDEVKITTNFETLSIIRSGVDVGDEMIEKPSKELWETLFNDFEFTYDKKEGNLKIAMIDVTGTRKEKNVIIFSDTDKYVTSVVYEETNKRFVFTFNNGDTITCPFSVNLEDYPTNNQVNEKINNAKKYVDNAIANLTAAGVGGNGKYIKAISEANGVIFAVEETMDIAPTNGSDKAITSGGVKKYVDEKLENYAKKDGYYETFGYAREAGIAKNLQNDEGKLLDPDVTTSGGTVYADQPFTQRATAMTMKAYLDNELITVGSGYEQWKKEQAFSIVRNNQAPHTNSKTNGITAIYDTSTRIFTLSGTSTSDYANLSEFPTSLYEHKILMVFQLISNPNNVSQIEYAYFNQLTKTIRTNGVIGTYGIIISPSSSMLRGQGVTGFSTGTDLTGIQFRIIQIDLTQWFASRPEIATALNGDEGVKWFLQNYPEALTLDYDEGTIVDTEDYDFETTGVNLWDEEWELGYYNADGIKENDKNTIRSKNYIQVFPNTSYYCITNAPRGLIVRLYDEDKKYLSTIASIKNTTFITPLNCFFITFCTFSSDSIKTYKNDIQICQHFTETSIEQTYHKYEIFKDRVSWAFTSTGKGKSAGSVADTKDYVNKKNIEKVGQVDLGTLNWSYNSTNESFYTTDLSTICKKVRGNAFTSSIYTNSGVKTISSMLNLEGQFLDNGALYLKNTSYNDTSFFKSAMSGVILNYELATPVITDMEGDELNTNIPENDYGVERKVPVSGDMFSGSATTIFYQDNPLRQIYNNKSSIDNLQEEVSGKQDAIVDYSNQIVDSAGLTYKIKRLFKLGKLVFLTVKAQNNTGNTITDQTTLFNLPILLGVGEGYNFVGCNGINIVRVRVESNSVKILGNIANGEHIYINIAYVMA